ncbi:MAG: hypothetical protein LC657_05620 [Desulfobacteraceae bacterium]|nr:hypothetical protein [Desulfobacteraceae bacterium]
MKVFVHGRKTIQDLPDTVPAPGGVCSAVCIGQWLRHPGSGSIYLAGVETTFDVKNKNNEMLAKIKRSSIALNEDGSVSSVQEADWTA